METKICKLPKGCDDELSIDDFHKNTKAKDGRQSICKKCKSKSNKEYNKTYVAPQTFESSINKLIGGARARAKKKNIPFDLSKEQLVDMWNDQMGLCAYTGEGMVFYEPFFIRENLRIANPFSCSLERIDSNKGYTWDNVVFVTYLVNSAKGPYDDFNLLDVILRPDIIDNIKKVRKEIPIKRKMYTEQLEIFND